jgi:RecA/RadA recombinase
MEKTILPELDIVTALFCKSKELHPYILKIEPEFFSDDLRGFFSVFQAYYRKYGKPPPKSVFKIEYAEGSPEQTRALDIFESIKVNFTNINILDPDYVLSGLNTFVKKSFIKKMLLDSYDSYDLGDYDKIIQNFNKLNEAIIDNNMGSSYFNPEFFVTKYDTAKTGSLIKSGSKQFDDNFGGFRKKTLTIVAGPSNSGKTMFLVNATASMISVATERKNILYITLEIDESQIGVRVDASLLGVPMKELRERIKTTTDESVIEKFVSIKESGNRLVIKSMRSGSNTADIEALVRNLSFIPLPDEEKVFKPDVILVDYFGLLRPNNPSKNANSYEKGREISEELRALAQDYNCAVICAAQTNRSSFGNDVGQDSISDSIAISQTADIMLTINRNESLDLANQQMLYLAKSRFSRAGAKFLFTVDYDTMRLNDLDVGDVNSVGDEL